jgi:hypothetical protein
MSLNCVYELAYNGEGKHGETFMNGLLDVNRLKNRDYDGNRSGEKEDLSGTGRPQVGPKSGGCRGEDRPLLPNDSETVTPLNGKTPKIAYQGEEKTASYRSRIAIGAETGAGR